ncbi:MAG: hypothetical protein ACI927_001857, partial [Oceanospirillaceae bacterium]
MNISLLLEICLYINPSSNAVQSGSIWILPKQLPVRYCIRTAVQTVGNVRPKKT